MQDKSIIEPNAEALRDFLDRFDAPQSDQETWE